MRNLISISGRIGSGKDTIGNIILFLLHKEHLKATDLQFDPNTDYSYGSHGFQIKKFAAKLKQIASILTGIPVEKFEDQEFKKTNLGKEWGIKYFHPDGGLAIGDMTVRDFLQKLGTDAIRNGLHEDTWLNAFWADYLTPQNVTLTVGDYSKYPKWIISDCRFENEYNSIKERGGLMIKVERPLAVCGTCYKTGTVNELNILSQSGKFVDGHCKIGDIIPNDQLPSHASETGLNMITDWDYVIQNDGTIEELIEVIRNILITEKIL